MSVLFVLALVATPRLGWSPLQRLGSTTPSATPATWSPSSKSTASPATMTASRPPTSPSTASTP